MHICTIVHMYRYIFYAYDGWCGTNVLSVSQRRKYCETIRKKMHKWCGQKENVKEEIVNIKVNTKRKKES